MDTTKITPLPWKAELNSRRNGRRARYVPQGGEITMCPRCERDEPVIARVQSTEPGGTLNIEVCRQCFAYAEAINRLRRRRVLKTSLLPMDADDAAFRRTLRVLAGSYQIKRG